MDSREFDLLYCCTILNFIILLTFNTYIYVFGHVLP
jgi:hypothetical protein